VPLDVLASTGYVRTARHRRRRPPPRCPPILIDIGALGGHARVLGTA
jgi:hypothetical protein